MATENKSTAGARAGAADSKDSDTNQKGPVSQSDAVTTSQGLNSTEGREANAKIVDERLEKLNEQNREGHDKNIKKIEEAAKQAAENSEKAPTSGKEWNRNTPRIDKDGNKHWY